MDRFPIVLLCPGSPLRNIITPGRGRGGNVGVLGSLDRHLHMLLSPFLLLLKIIFIFTFTFYSENTPLLLVGVEM